MNTLDQPSVTFRPAAFLSGSPGHWAGHLPFAFDLVAALRPQVIVELGVHYGDSYFGFCQAVAESHLACTCYGVDNWRGDAKNGGHASAIFDAVSRHNDRHYRAFSYLLRSSFDDAIAQFSDQSISLLHIDGARTFETAQQIFNSWLPKVRPGGVILLHDIAVRSGDYGVWRLWEDLQKKFPNFAFRNNNGLGVLWKPGGTDEKNPYLRELFSSSKENQERIRRYYCLCADRLELEHKLGVAGTSDAGHSLLEVTTAERLTQIVEAGKWSNVFLRLTDGMGGGELVIKPTNRTAVIDINSIFLRKVGGRTVWSWSAPENSDKFRVDGTAYRLPADDVLRILSFGNNPQVILPKVTGVAANEPLEMEIRMRVDLELGAVQQLAAGTAGPEKARELPLSSQREAEIVEQFERVRQELEKRLALAEEQVDQQRKAQMASIGERDRLHATHSLLSQEVSISKGNVDELKAEIERLSTMHAQMQGELTETRKANSRMVATLEHERVLRVMMENSWSWQLSKPLRGVLGLFKPRARMGSDF